MRVTVAALLLLASLSPRVAEAAGPTQLVIEDNDFLGPGGSDLQSTIPLLGDPDVRVLGFTVVVGSIKGVPDSQPPVPALPEARPISP